MSTLVPTRYDLLRHRRSPCSATMSKTLFLTTILFSTTTVVVAAPVPHNFPPIQDSLVSLDEMLHALPSIPDHVPPTPLLETFHPPALSFDTPFTPPSSPPPVPLPARIGRSDSAPATAFPRLANPSSTTRPRLTFSAEEQRWQLEQLKAEIRHRLYRSEHSHARQETGIRAPPNSPERDAPPTTTRRSTRS